MRREARYRCWLLVALLTLGAGESTKENAEPDDGLDVYFRDADVRAVADQGLPSYPDVEPGESKRIARDFPDEPPQISHAISEILPISLDDNECLECHDPENAIEATDIPIPESHFREAVMGDGGPNSPAAWVVKGYENTKNVAGTRYNCTMCHVPQATNVREPKNRFAPAREK